MLYSVHLRTGATFSTSAFGYGQSIDPRPPDGIGLAGTSGPTLTMVSRSTWFPDAVRTRDWWDEHWQMVPDRFGDPSPSLLSLAISNYQAKMRAVDIGSGNGRYAVELARVGYESEALEWTQTGCRRVKERARAHRVSVSCIQRDFLSVAHEVHEYDLVLSSGLLEELPDDCHSRAVDGLVNWAKQGGRIIIRYCTRIVGRGELVDSNQILRMLASNRTKLLFYKEESKPKLARSGLYTQAATIGAVRY